MLPGLVHNYARPPQGPPDPGGGPPGDPRADCEARAEDTNHLKREVEILQSTTERVGIRELLEAGVHFGHQAKRWNPKMKRYIFAQRAGVHIIDLDQTLTLLERALSFVRGVAEANREVLFVGTKKQAQIPLAEEAIRSGQPFVAERYIGGMLTNFQTILPRIQYFKDLAVRVDETPEEERTGKDWFALNREYQKLRRNFAGITEMERLPGGVFVIDPKREELLVKEANRLKIPVLALTDTNCDPEVIDYVIPGNDDAIRSISLISRLVADAIIAGRGEEVQVDERPVPPVIEDSQVEAEMLQTAEVTTEAPNGTSAGPPADEPEALTEPEAIPEAEETMVTVESEVVEEPEASTEVVETEVVEPDTGDVEAVEAEAVDEEAVEAEVVETIDAEAVEPEAVTEPEAEEIETEEAGPVEGAPDEESEETEEK
ncbi:MAG TPA: 30S ribosomal protein S2 [Rubrobacter sp.]|nr:30S ribosomal protein S2 [Rubrobacter sp.]